MESQVIIHIKPEPSATSTSVTGCINFGYYEFFRIFEGFLDDMHNLVLLTINIAWAPDDYEKFAVVVESWAFSKFNVGIIIRFLAKKACIFD